MRAKGNSGLAWIKAGIRLGRERVRSSTRMPEPVCAQPRVLVYERAFGRQVMGLAADGGITSSVRSPELRRQDTGNRNQPTLPKGEQGEFGKTFAAK